MMNIRLCLSVLLFATTLHAASTLDSATKAKQDSIQSKYLKRGAWRHHYFSHIYQTYIDSALREDSTFAYAWQQKAMPLFKERKYELGMIACDNAVRYDPWHWLDYRAFIKCIFCKTYRDALVDFAASKKIKGDAGVMDHTYEFYIGLCYLQLGSYDTARVVFENEIARTQQKQGKDFVHYLDLFYLGIVNYELQKYDEAIALFDQSLKRYAHFADAKYYKGQCLAMKGEREKGLELMREARKDFEFGYTINEDNAAYERYPYQMDKDMLMAAYE